jgi:hypothetical protein
MTIGSAKEMAQKAVNVVQGFFDGLGEKETGHLPEVLKSSGTWMAVSDASILAIFFLSEAEQKRIDRHKEKGWHPFPGLVISESQRPADQRAAYNIRGPYRFYSSKRSSNMFAFCISRDSSLTVVDHIHHIVDASGNRFTYTVDLAFILGLQEDEEWPRVKPRLSELLDYSMGVWKEP